MIQNPAVTAVRLPGMAARGVLAQNLPAVRVLCRNAAGIAVIRPARAVLGQLALRRQAYVTREMSNQSPVTAAEERVSKKEFAARLASGVPTEAAW